MRRMVAPIALIFTSVLAAFALAVAPIEAGGGGHGGCARAPQDGAGQHVTIEDNCYSPTVLYVQPGESVTWVNDDSYGHNVVTFDGELLGDQKQFFQGGQSGLMQGEMLSYVFSEPGVYPYYCSIHPSMLGVVVAGDPTGPEFGASLSLQSDPIFAGPSKPAQLSGREQGTPGASGRAEAIVGLALVSGLLLGLVAVGGGLRLRRR